MGRELVIDTMPVFKPLLSPSRYRGAHGGRGSGKSHFFAELLIEECLAVKGTRAVCIREVQKTLKESSKKLIEDKLKLFRLGSADGFKIFNECISTPGDGIMSFQGMQDHNAESIKSLEGYRLAWVEEAQTLSATSLSLLRPTMRYESGGISAEMWFSWNPRYKNDAVDMLLRGPGRPSEAVVVKANWSDNLRFPKILDQERLDCKRTDPDNYEHIWEGGYKPLLLGKLVYPEFARSTHVTAVSLKPDRATQIIVGWDNTGLCPAISLSWINPCGQWLIFKEFCFFDEGIMDATEALVMWCQANLPPGCTYRHIGDPAGNNRDSTKQTPAQYIQRKAQELGWSVSIENGVQTWKIRRESVADRLNRSKNGQPAMLIDQAGCPRLIEGFEGAYAYPEIGTTGIYRSEPADSDWTHIHDSIQYPATILFSLSPSQRDEERYCYPEA